MSQRPLLLIDAKNAVYRAVAATRADRSDNKYHNFVILLRQFNSWINKYQPESVHVFWDAPRKEVWRRKILPDYKDRSGKGYMEDISEELEITSNVAKHFLSFMNVRQYARKTMEADDLIYSAVSIMHPQPTVIVSSDSDMVQIPFTFNSCRVYNPFKRIELELTEVNPVIQKSLIGDTSDNIPGYYGIGPKKSSELVRDPCKLQEFFQISGSEIYYRNLLLIDLSLNPKLLHNKIYIQKKLADPIQFCGKTINESITKYKVHGLLQEYADLVMPYKKLL